MFILIQVCHDTLDALSLIKSVDIIRAWQFHKNVFHFFQNQYENSNAEIVCSALEVVGKYISWIDISLIANDKFVPVIIRYMSMPLLRESACDCIHDIISKGMDPLAKTKLVESFAEVLDKVGVLSLSEVRQTYSLLPCPGGLVVSVLDS